MEVHSTASRSLPLSNRRQQSPELTLPPLSPHVSGRSRPSSARGRSRTSRFGAAAISVVLVGLLTASIRFRAAGSRDAANETRGTGLLSFGAKRSAPTNAAYRSLGDENGLVDVAGWLLTAARELAQVGGGQSWERDVLVGPASASAESLLASPPSPLASSASLAIMRAFAYGGVSADAAAASTAPVVDRGFERLTTPAEAAALIFARARASILNGTMIVYAYNARNEEQRDNFARFCAKAATPGPRYVLAVADAAKGVLPPPEPMPEPVQGADVVAGLDDPCPFALAAEAWRRFGPSRYLVVVDSSAAGPFVPPALSPSRDADQDLESWRIEAQRARDPDSVNSTQGPDPTREVLPGSPVPFPPATVLASWHWSEGFTAHLRGRTRLVGSMISCEGRPNHNDPSQAWSRAPTISAFAWAVDLEGARALVALDDALRGGCAGAEECASRAVSTLDAQDWPDLAEANAPDARTAWGIEASSPPGDEVSKAPNATRRLQDEDGDESSQGNERERSDAEKAEVDTKKTSEDSTSVDSVDSATAQRPPPNEVLHPAFPSYVAEASLPLAVMLRGGEIDCLLARYRNVDWSRRAAWDCNARVRPDYEGSYDGATVSPFETIFVPERSTKDLGLSVAPLAARAKAWQDDGPRNFARLVANDGIGEEGAARRSGAIAAALALGANCFDDEYYARNNPDISYLAPVELFQQWVYLGQFQNRPVNLTCAPNAASKSRSLMLRARRKLCFNETRARAKFPELSGKAGPEQGALWNFLIDRKSLEGDICSEMPSPHFAGFSHGPRRAGPVHQALYWSVQPNGVTVERSSVI